MKLFYGILLLAFSLPAFGCSTYVCEIWGSNGLKLKLDLSSNQGCYAWGDPSDPNFCTSSTIPMKVVDNRWGNSEFGTTFYKYFEVAAVGPKGTTADVRIYSQSQPVACGTNEIPLYPADIALSWSHPVYARNPSQTVQPGDPVCFGLE